MHLPRFTIGRMMIIIAALAALDGPAFRVLVFVLLSAVFWFPSVYLGSLIGGLVDGGRAQAMSFVAILAVVLGLWLTGSYRGIQEFSFGLSFVVLTVANGAGPFLVADKFRRGLPITSGHLLWGWAGLVWPAQFFLTHPHRRGSLQETQEGSARLFLAAVILLLAFGKRPVGGDRMHHAGWLVVECNMIAWGLLAALTLKWIGWP